MIDDISREEERHSVLFGGRLQDIRHVYVGRQVARVNLEGRPDGAFNCPTNVKTKAERNSVVRHPGIEIFIVSVSVTFSRRPDACQHQHCAHNCHFASNSVLAVLSRLQLSVCRVDEGELLRDFPDQQEGVSNVLVGSPCILIHKSMHNLSHRVDEHHDFLL